MYIAKEIYCSLTGLTRIVHAKMMNNITMESRKKPGNIIHLDMDAFYASVEVLDNPSLKGKPVIVGGRVQRGVVSAASYTARFFGVHSAQPIAVAKRLCPDGVFLPVRMDRYREISRQIFEIFHRFTPLVEPLSIDEAFLDVTDSTRLFGDPEKIALNIKNLIRAETGLTASAGVAPSKFVAKIASDLGKPDGLTVVSPEQVRQFLEPLPINLLWGVGNKTREYLALLSVRTIGDLSRLPAEILRRKFGKHGVHLHLLSNGVDRRNVVPVIKAKSIGHEETFMEDILDIETAEKELLSLAMKVAQRLRKKGLKARTISLKVKYNDFTRITRSVTLMKAIDDGGEIFRNSSALLKKSDTGIKAIRLLGISVCLFESQNRAKQLSLFDQDAVSTKKRELNRALDFLSDKYGPEKVLPGTLVKPPGQNRRL